MATQRYNIPLKEEFFDDQWIDYLSFDPETTHFLHSQRHVDIRTFTQDSLEDWSTGSFGETEPTGNFPALTLPAVEGEVSETTSKTPDHTVDLETGFTDEDLIIFALAGWDNTANPEECFIDFTSDVKGDFGNEHDASVSLNQNLEPFAFGDQAVQIPRLALFEKGGGAFDPFKVTGVRFRFKAGSNEPFIIMGLKLVNAEYLVKSTSNPGWQVSTVDFDNWNGRIRKPTPLNGNQFNGAEFEQKTLWRVAPLSGKDDPKPIDISMGVVFYTGSQQNTNTFTFFAREESEIFQTMNDLIGVTMADLDGRPQPDLGTEAFLPRDVFTFDGDTIKDFDHNQQMKDLERTPVSNPAEQSWIYFTLQFGTTNGFTLANNGTAGYQFSKLGPGLGKLKDKRHYLLVCDLEGSTARARIYLLNLDRSVVQTPVFDSTLINDDATFRRRNGRIGWYARLEDPDAFIESLRPRSVNFAEYISAPLTSLTPVNGAQLFVNATTPTQLFNGNLGQFPPNQPEPPDSEISLDTTRSTTGQSHKIKVTGVAGFQGFETEDIDFNDFAHTRISFDLWFAGTSRFNELITVREPPTLPSPSTFPSAAKVPKTAEPHGLFPSAGRLYTIPGETFDNIIARLVSPRGQIYRLTMPEVEPNQWQHVVCSIPAGDVLLTGLYKLQIIQPPSVQSQWWVDNISILQDAIQWSARAIVDDAWHSNYAPWTDFGVTLNDKNEGIVLEPRGFDLQCRAKALRQDATIVQAPLLVPKYAQLGRLVWPEERLRGLTEPVAKFKATGSGHAFKFTDESESEVPIISREWTFGDGTRETGNSISVEPTYGESGTFGVTLLVTDYNGQRATHTQAV